ncbi:unnamed protein product, partial [Allacma fusca]
VNTQTDSPQEPMTISVDTQTEYVEITAFADAGVLPARTKVRKTRKDAKNTDMGEAVPLAKIACLPLTDGGMLQGAGQQQLQCEQGREQESDSHIKNLECNEQIPVQSPATLSIPIDDNATTGTTSVDILGSVQQRIETFDLEALQAEDVK